jgi:hypothetical protein
MIRGAFKPGSSTRCGHEPSQARRTDAELLALTGNQRPRFPAPTVIGNRGHTLPSDEMQPDRVAGIIRKEPIGASSCDSP